MNIAPTISFEHHEYPSYEFLEKTKQKSWDGFYECSARERCFRLLHGIIWSHYWRARINLERGPKDFYRKVMCSIWGKMPAKWANAYELDIDRYTNHWLWSQRNRGNIVDDEVMKIMDEFGYKPVKNKYMAEGYSEYS